MIDLSIYYEHFSTLCKENFSRMSIINHKCLFAMIFLNPCYTKMLK